MDKNYYKAKLKEALVKASIAKANVIEFANLNGKIGSLTGVITARIMELTPVSPSEAKTYIDYNTGKFKGGRGMTYCLDAKLKNSFTELENLFTKLKTQFNFKSSKEGISIYENLVANTQNIVNEMRKALGDNVAREVCTIAKAEAIKETGIQF